MTDSELVAMTEGVRNGEQQHELALYREILRWRGRMVKLIGNDWEDIAHDVYMLMVRKIRDYEIDRAETLPCFVWSTIKFTIWDSIRVGRRRKTRECEYVSEQSRLNENVHQVAVMIRDEQVAFINAKLSRCSPLQRSVLACRLRDQTPKETQAALDLTDSQYRNAHYHAKQKVMRAHA